MGSLAFMISFIRLSPLSKSNISNSRSVFLLYVPVVGHADKDFKGMKRGSS